MQSEQSQQYDDFEKSSAEQFCKAELRKTATVTEDKFNGTATLNVEIPESVDKPKRRAKGYARRYFEQVHGSSPSKVVVEHDEHRYPTEDVIPYTVMIADHSSGSLNEGKQYEVNVSND